MAVGQARGVVLLAAAQHGTPVREATPNEVKSAITGYGAADKEQVQRMVQLVLGMSGAAAPDDAADALAIAIWVANTDRGPPRPASSIGPRWRRSPAARPATNARSARPSPPSAQRRRRRSRPAVPDHRGAGYERATREALTAERAAKRSAS